MTRGSRRSLAGAAAAALLLLAIPACDCGGSTPGEDAGRADAAVTSDASSDAAVADALTPDIGGADSAIADSAIADSAIADLASGDDTASDDASASLDAVSSDSASGDVVTADVGVDAGPALPICDDGRCNGDETATSCPQDCGVVDVALGFTHTCAALADGTLRCWGDHLGHRMGGLLDTATPTLVHGVEGAVAVGCGRAHSCALLEDGAVMCWGRNQHGEVGAGATSHDVYPPLAVSGLSGAIQISVGHWHACAHLTGDTLECWGRGDVGQVGGGVFKLRNPAPVDSGLSGVRRVAAGFLSTCVRTGPSLRCVGYGVDGLLAEGDGLWRASYGFGAILLPGPSSIGVGFRHACITVPFEPITESPAAVLCWGSNSMGQLGIGGSARLVPTLIPGVEPGGAVSVGRDYACILERGIDEQISCWGSDQYGKAGGGNTGLVSSPTTVPGLDGVTKVVAGWDHTCALLDDATLRCWGRNHLGQLGRAAPADLSTTPIEPLGL